MTAEDEASRLLNNRWSCVFSLWAGLPDSASQPRRGLQRRINERSPDHSAAVLHIRRCARPRRGWCWGLIYLGERSEKYGFRWSM